MRSRMQREGQRRKFTFTASTSARKTCRLLSGLLATQRILYSISAASIALQVKTSGPTSATKPSSSVFRTEEVHTPNWSRRLDEESVEIRGDERDQQWTESQSGEAQHCLQLFFVNIQSTEKAEREGHVAHHCGWRGSTPSLILMENELAIYCLNYKI